jgi:hypothetical protein
VARLRSTRRYGRRRIATSRSFWAIGVRQSQPVFRSAARPTVAQRRSDRHSWRVATENGGEQRDQESDGYTNRYEHAPIGERPHVERPRPQENEPGQSRLQMVGGQFLTVTVTVLELLLPVMSWAVTVMV